MASPGNCAFNEGGSAAETRDEAEKVSRAADVADGEGREELFRRVAHAPSIAERLEKLRRRPRRESTAPHFGGVGEAAQPFLIALLQRELGAARIWIVCDDLRAQERIHAGLQAWGVNSLFLPRLELAPIPGALPDPELNAERLSTLAQLAQESTASTVAVILKSQWTEEVPSPAALRDSFFRLAVGDTSSLERVAGMFLQSGL